MLALNFSGSPSPRGRRCHVIGRALHLKTTTFGSLPTGWKIKIWEQISYRTLKKLFPLKRGFFFYYLGWTMTPRFTVETRGIKAKEEHSVQLLGSECERTKQPSHIWASTRAVNNWWKHEFRWDYAVHNVPLLHACSRVCFCNEITREVRTLKAKFCQPWIVHSFARCWQSIFFFFLNSPTLKSSGQGRLNNKVWDFFLHSLSGQYLTFAFVIFSYLTTFNGILQLLKLPMPKTLMSVPTQRINWQNWI